MDPNVVWDHGAPRDERWAALGCRGATLWFTGLSGSGKSTIARAVEWALIEKGVTTYRLDGDNVRHGLNRDLGFDDDAREENIRRIGEVSALFADAGVVTLVSFISPFVADRAKARSLHEGQGLTFAEVFVDTPIEECMKRDPKGLYRRAQAGEIANFTGLDSPYEPPNEPELHLKTTQQSIEQSVAACVEYLKAAGWPGLA